MRISCFSEVVDDVCNQGLFVNNFLVITNKGKVAHMRNTPDPA